MPETGPATRRLAEDLVFAAVESFTILGPDGHGVRRDDLIQFISPTIPHGAMNTVVRSRFSARDIEIKAEEALRRYRELRLPCWWLIGPNSLNRVETEKYLVTRQGFQLDHVFYGLIRSTSDELARAYNLRVTVERVTADNLGDYLRAATDGGIPSTTHAKYFEWVLQRHGPRVEIFLARVDGEPAGTGVLQYFGEAANFVSGFVRPRFRGMGAYRALLQARLQRLRERQVPLAIVLSKAHTSAPILLNKGFVKIAEFRTLERKA